MWLNPYNSTTALIYDPVRDQTTVPAGTYSGAAAYSSSLLLPSGEVFLIPRNAACAVYSPATNSVRTIGAAPGVADAYFYGAVLQDGRVFVAPYNTNTAWLVDTERNTVTAASGNFSNANIGQLSGFANGAVLLPDGRVLTVPGEGRNFFIYDPYLNRTTAIDVTGYAATGALLMPDGKVLMASSRMIIYDWQRNTIRQSRDTLAVGPQGMTLLPDGRVFLSSLGAVYYVYNYLSDSFSTINSTVVTNAATGGTLIPDGRFVMYPRGGTSTVDAYGTRSRGFSEEVLLSPHYNYRR
jgi:hypothetical protein